MLWAVCIPLRAAIINVPTDYPTISAAVAAASPGDEIVVAPGTYSGSVTINKANLTLRSSGGKAATVITGTSGLGTILIQADGFTLGGVGQGFTIIGYDSPSPALEYAAVYIQGVRSNITIRDNEIVADGEAGLLSEFGNAVTNLVVSGNIFSGKTFVGPEAGDCGFANQFTAPNVPRQLVTIQTGSGVMFTSNMITGTAGSISSFTGPPDCTTFGQGNTLVTIDANNATIRGNTFAGTTTRFAHSLRVRGNGANISCNTFDNTGLGPACVHIFFTAASLAALGTPSTLAGVASANVFINEGAYFTGATQIYRNAAQVVAIPQTPIAANSTPFPLVTNINTGENYCSIQSAIDDPLTLSGHTLSLASGTYIETVTVTKSLTILGPNATINPCDAMRLPEAILMPPTSQPFYDGTTEVILMEVQANNVTVKGLTFDGDNPALINSDGGPIDAADGLDVFSNVSGLLVENNIFKNLNEGGVTGYPSGSPAQTNNTVINNRFENIPGDEGMGYPLSGYGIGVLIYNNFYTNVEDNCMEDVRIGVQTGNYYLADPGNSRNIKNNQIESKAVGIFHNLHYNSASPFTVEDNTISAADPGNTGMILWSFLGSAGSTVKNNVISGGTWGIEFWNNPTSSTITVEGGSITGAATGVLASNYDNTYGNAANTTVAIKGVTISGSTTRAVHVEDSPLNTNGATIALQIKDDCDIAGPGAPTGVLVDGADASALIQNNNASIHGFPIGIDVNAGSATITGNHIYDNGIGIRFTNGGNGSVTNNDFTGTTHNGTDLRLDATAGIVNADGNNHFAGINFGVDNQSAAIVDAENNYWNHPSGPSAPPQAFGTGARISNNVDYCPFYGAPGGPALPATACACGIVCAAPVTYTGSITISTQTQMDAFKHPVTGCKYTHVTGNLILEGNHPTDPITDMCNLQELLSVAGNFVIRRFTDPANPTNLNDLNKLQSVGNNFTIGGSAVNQNTSFAGSSFNFPNLTTVGNNLTVTNNTGITGVSMPILAGTLNAVEIHSNDNSVATIDLSSVTAITGTGNFGNTLPHATSANVDLGSLTTVGANLIFNRTAAMLNISSLVSVGNNLTIDNNSGPIMVNIPSLNNVGGTLSIDNNSSLSSVNIPTMFTGPSGAMSITGNTGLNSVVVGILSTTGNVNVFNNGTGVTTINLNKLQTVGNNLNMGNGAANAVSAAINLSALTSVGNNMVLNHTIGSITALMLTNVGGNFTANNNSATWTNFDTSFPMLASITGNLTVQNNSGLGTCCRIPCPIVAGSKIVNNNTGNCLNLTVATTNCTPMVNITGPSAVCLLGTVTLNGNPVSTDLPLTHAWAISGGTGSATFVDNMDGTADFTGTAVGTVNITYTATSASGCTGTATFTLAVEAPPTMSACLSDLTLNTDAGVCTADFMWTHPNVIGGGASCLPATMEVDYGLGGGFVTITPATSAMQTFPLGATTVKYQLKDVNGNIVDSCSWIVTVVDNQPPTISAGTINSCYPTATSAEADAISATMASDNCTYVTLSASTAGTCSATITVTATDGAGNTAIVTYTTRIDDTQPTFPNPPDATFTTSGDGATCPDTASISLTPSMVTPVATGNAPFTFTVHGVTVNGPTVYSDNCSSGSELQLYVWNINTSYTGTSLPCIRRIRVVWRVYDACGNFRQRDQVFTIVDDTAPALVDMMTTCSSLDQTGVNECLATAAAFDPTTLEAAVAGLYSDNCTSVTATYTTTTPGAGNSDCGWSFAYDYTISDECGNSTTCTVTRSGSDQTPPTVTAGTIASCYPTVAAAEAAAIAATTASDSCTASPMLTASTTGTCSATITVTATDDCGNTASVTYTTTIDGTPPMLTCPPTQTLMLGPTCSATLPDYTDLATVSDSCALMSVTQSPAAGTTVSDAGPLTVTLTATDSCGNTSTCTFTVNKVDVTPPTVTCLPDTVTFNGEPSISLDPMDLVIATDNCGIASITLSPSVILCSQLGQVVPVTVTVTDINGNVSTCTSDITVDGLPCGWSHTPGSVGCNSTAAYNTMTSVWTATATDCFYGPSFTTDVKAFVERPLCGNGSITVRVTGISPLATGWAGIVMRDGNAQGAKKIQLMTNLSNLHRREIRTVTNGSSYPQQFPANGRYWLRLVRNGNQFSGFVSPDGVTWYFVMSANIDMPNCIKMGLIVTNYSPSSGVTTTATFDNLSTTGSLTPLMAPANTPIDLVGQEVELDFSVFPNPTEGQLNLEVSKYLGRQVRIEVYNAQGQLVKFSELDEVQQNLERIDISEQTAGLYIIRLKSPGIPDVTKRAILSKMLRP